MEKLNSKEIIKLLDILIGKTEPIGESNYDEKVLSNLKTLIDVTNWCLDGVFQASEYIHRPEYSMNIVGFNAQCALQELMDWLSEKMEVDDGLD